MAEASATVEVARRSIAARADQTRIVLDLSGPTTHSVMELKAPDRLVSDAGSGAAAVLTDLPLEEDRPRADQSRRADLQSGLICAAN